MTAAANKAWVFSSPMRAAENPCKTVRAHEKNKNHIKEI